MKNANALPLFETKDLAECSIIHGQITIRHVRRGVLFDSTSICQDRHTVKIGTHLYVCMNKSELGSLDHYLRNLFDEFAKGKNANGNCFLMSVHLSTSEPS